MSNQRDEWTKAVTKLQMRPERSKYGAKKTTADGKVFDSAKEAKRYQELRALQMAGQIRALALQQKFGLWVHTGLVQEPPIEIGAYVADFTYEEQHDGDWRDVIEDVKGFKTALYKWKKKHFEAQYGLTIRET